MSEVLTQALNLLYPLGLVLMVLAIYFAGGARRRTSGILLSIRLVFVLTSLVVGVITTIIGPQHIHGS
jgi:hypothetical protein